MLIIREDNHYTIGLVFSLSTHSLLIKVLILIQEVIGLSPKKILSDLIQGNITEVEKQIKFLFSNCLVIC